MAVAAAPVVSMVRRTGSIISVLLDHLTSSRPATLYAARASAIDIDDLAGHETGALGAEKKDHGRDFLGCSDAAERDARNGAAVILLGRHPARPTGRLAPTLPPRRIDPARVDAGDQPVVLGAVFGQRLGEAEQPGIDRPAGEIHRPRLVPRPSDHVDDAQIGR